MDTWKSTTFSILLKKIQHSISQLANIDESTQKLEAVGWKRVSLSQCTIRHSFESTVDVSTFPQQARRSHLYTPIGTMDALLPFRRTCTYCHL